MIDDFEKIEFVWERYFYHNKTSYQDSIRMTRAIADYGAEAVLEALRWLYNKRVEITNFAYVQKTVEQMVKSGVKQIHAEYVNPTPEEFKSKSKKEREKQEDINAYRRFKRQCHVRHALRGNFPHQAFHSWLMYGDPELPDDVLPPYLQEIYDNWIRENIGVCNENFSLEEPNLRELYGVNPRGKAYTWEESISTNRAQERSKTFIGVARAMATQWGMNNKTN